MNMKCIVLLFLTTMLMIGCSDQLEPCAKSWKLLKNPCLDFIADRTADLKAKIANGYGSQEDSQEIYRLQQEENKIWDKAKRACN